MMSSPSAVTETSVEQLKHRPGPWGVTYFRDSQFRIECGSGSTRFLIAKTTSDTNLDKANALFIVLAVNAHDDMLAALKRTTEVVEDIAASDEHYAIVSAAHTAIAKAEGRTP